MSGKILLAAKPHEHASTSGETKMEEPAFWKAISASLTSIKVVILYSTSTDKMQPTRISQSHRMHTHTHRWNQTVTCSFIILGTISSYLYVRKSLRREMGSNTGSAISNIYFDL